MAISVSALAQSGQSMQSRIDRLEREIQTLSRAVYRGEKPPQSVPQETNGDGESSDFRANIQVQLSDIEQRLRELTGKYQQSRNRIDKLEQRLETALSDIRMRLEKLESAQKQPKDEQPQDAQEQESRSSATSGDSTQSARQDAQDGQSGEEDILGTIPANPDDQAEIGSSGQRESESGDSGSASESGQATGAYEQAFARLQAGEYEASAKAFQSFIDNHPDHKLAENAQYWLGESYYARDQYEKAARTFADAYQNHPEGKKAADNLLKLGLSLEAMDRKEDACVALGQLQDTFDDTSGPVVSRADKEMERIGCE